MINRTAALALLVLVLLFEGLYSQRLNTNFYREHIPFYDSCSYTTQLAEIYTVARTEGLAAALTTSVRGRNVTLPWIETALLSRWVRPSRSLGTWLQWPWLMLLACSIFWYLSTCRQASPVEALVLTLPFVAFESVFHWAGGLPDFRMDLSLYIFLSLAAVWLLIASDTGRGLHWFLAGCAGVLACLARATAPVYLVLLFLPIILASFVSGRSRRNLVWFLLPFLPGLAWLGYNYSFLHTYYVVWSPDANRGLPVRQSLLHLILGPAHLGIPLATAALAVLVARLLRNYKTNSPHGQKGEWAFDWRLLWLGLAPCLFLVIRGVGLNPHVSMPAVFGLLMFSLFPFRANVSPPRWALWALTGACLLTAGMATQRHVFRGVDVTSMPRLREVIDRMETETARRGETEVQYAIPSVGLVHNGALTNTLIYEYGGVPSAAGIRLPSGRIYSFPHEAALTASDPWLWQMNVPGATEKEQMDSLVGFAMSERFLLLPTDNSLTFLEQRHSFNLINLKIRELKRRLLASGTWTRLGSPIAVTPDEQIEIFGR